MITNLAFGDSLSLLTSGKNRQIVHIVDAMSALMSYRAECPRVARTLIEKIASPVVFRKAFEYTGMVRMMVSKRISAPAQKQETEARDIFSHMLRARDPDTGEGLPLAQLWADGSSFVFAGTLLIIPIRPSEVAKIKLNRV